MELLTNDLVQNVRSNVPRGEKRRSMLRKGSGIDDNSCSSNGSFYETSSSGSFCGGWESSASSFGLENSSGDFQLPRRGQVPLKIHKLTENLFGRDEETATIQQVVDRVILTQRQLSEVLLIHGDSGAGKTALVNRFFKEGAIHGKAFFFASAKFAQFETTNHAAVVDAVTELCYLIQDASAEVKTRIESAVRDKLGEEVSALAKHFPMVCLALPEIRLEEDDGLKQTYAAKECSFQRSIFLLRMFLNAVAEAHPLVLLLDDLQWADDTSRQLVRSFALDTTSHNVLLVGLMREEGREGIDSLFAQDDEHALPTLPMTRLHVGPISAEDVNLMVAAVTEMDPKKTARLAQIVFQKTGANPYFVVQYLEMLYRTELLRFSFQTSTWEWDTDSITTKTQVSGNVVGLLTEKIATLPRKTQIVLMVASCLGFSIDAAVLDSLCVKIPRLMFETFCRSAEAGGEVISSLTSKGVSKALSTATKAGLVQKSSTDGTYQFSHDKVRQSAVEMIPDNAYGKELRRFLGMTLLSLSRQEGALEWMLFSAIDLLEAASDSANTNLAELCLEAADRASESSAFVTSAKYADKGLARLLPSDRWTEHYDLSLRLSLLSAEMNYSCGKLEESNTVVSEVLRCGRCLDDTFPAYMVRLATLGAQADMPTALIVGNQVLDLLGVHIPKPTPISVNLSVLRTARLMKDKPPSFFLDHKAMTDKNKIRAMEVLDLIIVYDWRRGDMDMLLLHILKMIKLTTKYGMSPHGPLAMTAYGVVVAVLGDLEGAFEFGRVAQEMSLKPGVPQEGVAATIKVNHLILHHIKRPIFTSIKPSLHAVQIAKEIGDLMISTYCLQMHGMISIVVGQPLKTLEKELLSYCNYCKEFRQTAVLHELVPYHQLALNLMGRAADPLVLTGDAMTEEYFVKQRQISTSGSSAVLCVIYARTMLLYLLDELALADVERRKISNPKDDFVSCYFGKYLNYFYCGMTCLGLARQEPKKRRKHTRHATYYIREIKKLAKVGSVNCVHMLTLLNAEKKSLTDTSKRMQSEYDSAIAMSGRTGFRVVCAVALERAGEYMLRCRDNYSAGEYLGRAWSEFADYGAKAKLDQMKQKYAGIPLVKFDEPKRQACV